MRWTTRISRCMSMSDYDNTILGSPICGLVGPYAFPFQWTFQRNRGGRKSSRKAMHRLTGVKGMPLFIEAVPPPFKHLRNMLQELGEDVCSYQYQIDEDIFALFGGETALNDADEVILDFTQALTARSCPRYGTWKKFNEQRDRFYKHFAKLQRRAVANGRYFPPPTILCARIHRTNGVRMEMGFSEGFLPGNKLLVTTFPFSVTGVVKSTFRPNFNIFIRDDEPVPAGQSLHEQIDTWVAAFCRTGESLVFAGFIQGLAFFELHHVWHALAEGDELTVHIEEKPFLAISLVWRERILGRVAWGDSALALCTLREDKPLRVVIVRLHAFHESSFGQIAFAMYK